MYKNQTMNKMRFQHGVDKTSVQKSLLEYQLVQETIGN